MADTGNSDEKNGGDTDREDNADQQPRRSRKRRRRPSDDTCSAGRADELGRGHGDSTCAGGDIISNSSISSSPSSPSSPSTNSRRHHNLLLRHRQRARTHLHLLRQMQTERRKYWRQQDEKKENEGMVRRYVQREREEGWRRGRIVGDGGGGVGVGGEGGGSRSNSSSSSNRRRGNAAGAAGAASGDDNEEEVIVIHDDDDEESTNNDDEEEEDMTAEPCWYCRRRHRPLPPAMMGDRKRIGGEEERRLAGLSWYVCPQMRRAVEGRRLELVEEERERRRPTWSLMTRCLDVVRGGGGGGGTGSGSGSGSGSGNAQVSNGDAAASASASAGSAAASANNAPPVAAAAAASAAPASASASAVSAPGHARARADSDSDSDFEPEDTPTVTTGPTTTPRAGRKRRPTKKDCYTRDQALELAREYWRGTWYWNSDDEEGVELRPPPPPGGRRRKRNQKRRRKQQRGHEVAPSSGAATTSTSTGTGTTATATATAPNSPSSASTSTARGTANDDVIDICDSDSDSDSDDGTARSSEGSYQLSTCCECGQVEDRSADVPVLLCDGCSNACHLTCARAEDGRSTFAEVPEGDWFCSVCVKRRKKEKKVKKNKPKPKARPSQPRVPPTSRESYAGTGSDTDTDDDDEDELQPAGLEIASFSPGSPTPIAVTTSEDGDEASPSTPVEGQAIADESDQWECWACTLLNDRAALQCEACEAHRPRHTRQRRYNSASAALVSPASDRSPSARRSNPSIGVPHVMSREERAKSTLPAKRKRIEDDLPDFPLNVESSKRKSRKVSSDSDGSKDDDGVEEGSTSSSSSSSSSSGSDEVAPVASSVEEAASPTNEESNSDSDAHEAQGENANAESTICADIDGWTCALCSHRQSKANLLRCVNCDATKDLEDDILNRPCIEMVQSSAHVHGRGPLEGEKVPFDGEETIMVFVHPGGNLDRSPKWEIFDSESIHMLDWAIARDSIRCGRCLVQHNRLGDIVLPYATSWKIEIQGLDGRRLRRSLR